MGNRDITLLTDDTQKKRLEFHKRVKEQLDHDIFITDGFRSEQEQNELYAQGRTKPGSIVTYTTESTHELGISFDIAFKGKELYPKSLEVRVNVIEVANSIGLDSGYQMWGRDKPHFQNNGTPIENYLEPKYKPTENEKKKLKILLKVNSWFWDRFPIKSFRVVLHNVSKEIRELLGE